MTASSIASFSTDQPQRGDRRATRPGARGLVDRDERLVTEIAPRGADVEPVSRGELVRQEARHARLAFEPESPVNELEPGSQHPRDPDGHRARDGADRRAGGSASRGSPAWLGRRRTSSDAEPGSAGADPPRAVCRPHALGARRGRADAGSRARARLRGSPARRRAAHDALLADELATAHWFDIGARGAISVTSRSSRSTRASSAWPRGSPVPALWLVSRERSDRRSRHGCPPRTSARPGTWPRTTARPTRT